MLRLIRHQIGFELSSAHRKVATEAHRGERSALILDPVQEFLIR